MTSKNSRIQYEKKKESKYIDAAGRQEKA